jgi:hypothetical protein
MTGGLMSTVLSAAAAVGSALLVAVAGYFAGRSDLKRKFDESLRELRIDAYTDLWCRLEPIAKYGRPENLEQAAAQQLRDRLKEWYFKVGGSSSPTRRGKATSASRMALRA